MAFWKGRGAARENIRLFEATKTWRRYADEVDATTGEVKERGASRAIDGFLLNGLNATNLLLLTGAGSSFCVVNATASKLKVKTAPGPDIPAPLPLLVGRPSKPPNSKGPAFQVYWSTRKKP